MSTDPHERGTSVLRIAHHHPGRLRLRSEAFLGDGDPAAAALEALAATPGIQSTGHDPQTGSLLITYDPGRITADTIARGIARAARLRPAADPEAPRRSQGGRVLDMLRDLNAAAYQSTGFRLDLRAMVPAALACLSVTTLVLGKGSRAPRWDSLAYWSVNLFAMFHGRETTAPPEADRPPWQAPR